VIDSVQKVVEVVPAANKISVSEIEGEPDELQAQAIDESTQGDITAQDATIARGDPGEGDVVNTRDADDMEFTGSIVSEDDSGDARIFLLKDDGSDNFDHQFPIQVTSIDGDDFIPQADSSFDFQDYDFFPDLSSPSNGGEPYRGPGEYGYMVQFEQDDGQVFNDTRDDSFFIYTYEMEITRPNSNETFNKQDVPLEFDVTSGEGGSDVDVLLDGSQVDNFDPNDGHGDVPATLSLQENEGVRTFLIDDEEVSFETVSVDNGADTGDLSINGAVQEVGVGETFTVNGESFEVTNVAADSSYEEITLEHRLEVSTTLNNVSDGQHTVKIRGDANNSDPQGSGNRVISDSVDFSVNLNNPPTAAFTFSPSSPSANETIQFTDNSTDDKGIVKW